jgi:sugar lactone lactonase YvrE
VADVRIVPRDRRDTLGEGLLWSARDGAVCWTDILGKRVNRLTLASGAIDSCELPDVVGWLVEREAGGFVAGVGRGVVALTLDPLTVTPLVSLDEPEDNRVNDAKADAAGRIWFGTMPFGCDRPVGSFYRLDRGEVARIEGGYTIPNGPAVADDFLLHTDTALGTIFRYPLRDDGSTGPRTPFVTFEEGWGSPDGMAFDADGNLWVACWGASCVAQFDTAGKRIRTIGFPASQITNVVFAGERLERMFVTSAADGVDEEHGGALFEVDAGCRGRAPYRYKG